jgi:hypothetical protein
VVEEVLDLHWPLVVEVVRVKLKTSLLLLYKVETHSQSLWALEVLLALVESIPLCVIPVLRSRSQPIRALPVLQARDHRAELVAPVLDRAMSPTMAVRATQQVVLEQVLVPQPMAAQPRAVKVAQLHRALLSQ